MKFKVHWIIDGIAEIEGESKEDAEKLQESLEEYVKNSEDLMNNLLQNLFKGTAYLEGEKNNEKEDENEKKRRLAFLLLFVFLPLEVDSVGRKYEPEEGTFDRRKKNRNKTAM